LGDSEAETKPLPPQEFIEIRLGRPPWIFQLYLEPRRGLLRLRRFNRKTGEEAGITKRVKLLTSDSLADALNKADKIVGGVFDPEGWSAIRKMTENMYNILPKSRPPGPKGE
jgi:hypothetical protein